MKDAKSLLDMYDRGASQEEIRTEAELLGISKEDLELEVAALDSFVAHENARARALEALPPLERLRLLVETITRKNCPALGRSPRGTHPPTTDGDLIPPLPEAFKNGRKQPAPASPVVWLVAATVGAAAADKKRRVLGFVGGGIIGVIVDEVLRRITP